MKKFVLVSSSPRRAEILSRAGFDFEILPHTYIEEQVKNDDPAEYVKTVALKKLSFVKPVDDKIYVAFDTIVVIDGKTLFKPSDESEAKYMLTLLSGRWHEVFTGIAIKDSRKVVSDFERTKVKFYELSYDEIEAYIATGEPMDKAGAYGIQEKGALFIERIEGCYFNVVGLPLPKFARMLNAFDVTLKEILAYA